MDVDPAIQVTRPWVLPLMVMVPRPTFVTASNFVLKAETTVINEPHLEFSLTAHGWYNRVSEKLEALRKLRAVFAGMA